MIARARCACFRSSQKPGASIAAASASGGGQAEPENFRVELASLGSVPETEHLGNPQKIAAAEKLEEGEAVAYIRPGSAEARQQLFGRLIRCFAIAVDLPEQIAGILHGKTGQN